MNLDLFSEIRKTEKLTNGFFSTKKEIIQSSKNLAKTIIENGNHNLHEVFSKIVRLETAVESFKDEIKNCLPNENFESFGIKGVYKNGGSTPNYTDDPIYANLHKQLKERETLLKMALSVENNIYDSEGVEVPKVSLNQRKSSLNIFF